MNAVVENTELVESAKAPVAAKDVPPFWQIVITYWVPATITAVVGGLTLAVIVPYVQASYAYESALKQRQVQSWEALALAFSQYISARGRLNNAARTEMEARSKGEAIDPDFMKRKDEYRAQRDEASVRLRGELVKAEFYFGDDVKQLVDQYTAWHSKYATATLEQLPPDEDYNRWRHRILSAIGNKLKTTLGG